MTTRTVPCGVTFARAATMLAGHLAEHALPEPASLIVSTSYGHSALTAQPRGDTVPGLTVDLLAWANALTMVAAQAWCPPERGWVHLSIHRTLTGPAGAVELRAFGGVDYDPLRFADLLPHAYRGMSLPLARLRTWAAHPPATTVSHIRDEHQGAP